MHEACFHCLKSAILHDFKMFLSFYNHYILNHLLSRQIFNFILLKYNFYFSRSVAFFFFTFAPFSLFFSTLRLAANSAFKPQGNFLDCVIVLGTCPSLTTYKYSVDFARHNFVLLMAHILEAAF